MKSYMCVVCGFVYDEEKGLPDEGIPPGHADANRMQQVLVNLLVNAGDAMTEEGGTITVATDSVQDADFGVKWKTQRGCLPSQAMTLGCLWVP